LPQNGTQRAGQEHHSQEPEVELDPSRWIGHSDTVRRRICGQTALDFRHRNPGGQSLTSSSYARAWGQGFDDANGPSKRTEYAAWAFLLLFALAMRFYALGSQSIWIDEAYSMELAAKSFPEIISETARDNHPPAYYLLLAVWMRAGSYTEDWARTLSAVLGALLIAAFYRFCRAIAPWGVALIAAGLLAASPLAVWHSQDARMYALMLATMYWALCFFLAYLRSGSRLHWGLFVSMLAAALYSHIYSLFVLPVFVTHLFWDRAEIPRARMRGALMALGIAATVYLPWIIVVMASAMRAAGFYKPITLLTIPYTFYAFSVGYSLGPSVAELHRYHQGVDLASHLKVEVFLAAGAFGVAFVAGLRRLSSLVGKYSALIMALLVFPILLPIGVTRFSQIDFNARYAILALPAYLFVIAVGLISLRPLLARFVVGLAVVSLMAGSLYNLYTNPSYAKEDTRSAFRLVQGKWEPGDCVYVIGVYSAFQYYSRDTTIRSGWVDFRSPQRAEQAERTLEQSERGCRRIWFLSGREWEVDPIGLAVPTFEKFFDVAFEQRVPGIRVLQMRPRRQVKAPGDLQFGQRVSELFGQSDN
jgi:mannosyltransferase